MNTKIPPSPDFDKIEAEAISTAEQRKFVLALIGNLIFSWSNNESMFIYLLMALMKTDLDSAVITFATLNTTRARLDLIRRLAKAKLDDPAMIKKIEKLMERFNKCTRVRNEFNHCIYKVNEKGEITHTTILRIRETKSDVKISTMREIDKRRINEITSTIERLKVINRDLWNILPELEKAVAGSKKSASSA